MIQRESRKETKRNETKQNETKGRPRNQFLRRANLLNIKKVETRDFEKFSCVCKKVWWLLLVDLTVLSVNTYIYVVVIISSIDLLSID